MLHIPALGRAREMAILATGRVGKDFRLIVPREVRELLELEEGEERARI